MSGEAKKQHVEYIYPVASLNDWTANAGSRNKVNAQLKAFEQNGLSASLVMMPILPKYIRALPFQTSNIDWKNIRLQEKTTAVYIRYGASNFQLLRFLKNQKRQYPKRKIIVEFPTFPYDKEPMNLLIKMRDRFYRKYLHKYVDRCVLLWNVDSAFHIPAIITENGVDCDKIQQRTPHLHRDDTIRLLAVASIESWHGYDRVIKGLGKYYRTNPERCVELHLVGDGEIVPSLKQLCKEYNVEEYVRFHGWMMGQELEDIFNQCDIGVGCLGVHRKGITYTCTLKLREYAARGIPFFYGDIDITMEEYFKEYLMNVPANDEPIVIADVIRFYDETKEKGFDKIAFEMHQLAEENISWKKKIKPVVEYIFSSEAKSNRCEE